MFFLQGIGSRRRGYQGVVSAVFSPLDEHDEEQLLTLWVQVQKRGQTDKPSDARLGNTLLIPGDGVPPTMDGWSGPSCGANRLTAVFVDECVTRFFSLRRKEGGGWGILGIPGQV